MTSGRFTRRGARPLAVRPARNRSAPSHAQQVPADLFRDAWHCHDESTFGSGIHDRPEHSHFLTVHQY